MPTRSRARPNPARMDPTRTAGLRRAWLAELRRRFRRVKTLVRALVEEDAFGLGEVKASPLAANVARFFCVRCGRLVTNASFFESCPRDEKGRCTSTGGADPGATKEVAKDKAEERKDDAQAKVEEAKKKVDDEHGELRPLLTGADRDILSEHVMTGAYRKLDAAGSKHANELLEAAGKLPKYAGPAFRGIVVPKELLDKMIKSGRITEAPITSFSVRESDVDRFADPSESRVEGGVGVIIRTTLVDGRHLGAAGFDEEVLARKSEFRIVGVKKDNQGRTILNVTEVSVPGEHRWALNRQPAANAGRYAFLSNPDKLKAFQAWLAKLLRAEVLGRTEDELWRRYVEEGFRRGQGRVWSDFKSKADPEYLAKPEGFFEGSREEFLRSSFARPVAVEKVQLLTARVFTDLKGVTDGMAATMTRVLADGLVQGQSPREVGKTLADAIDISEARAERIARTETIRTHAEGQLQALEDLGVTEVGVQVEWLATADTRTCPKCREMEGQVFAVEDAAGLIPLHPNCRCAWIPAGDIVTNRRKAAWNQGDAWRGGSKATAMALERLLSPDDLALRRLLLNVRRK